MYLQQQKTEHKTEVLWPILTCKCAALKMHEKYNIDFIIGPEKVQQNHFKITLTQFLNFQLKF